MNNSRTRKGTTVILTSIIVVVLGLLIGVSYAFGELWLRTKIFNFVKSSTPFWVYLFWFIIAPVIIGTAILIYRSETQNSYNRNTGESTKSNKMMLIIPIMLIVGGLGNLIPGTGLAWSKFYRSGHDVREQIADVVTATEAAHPEYLRRSNSVQARRIVEETNNDPAISDTTEIQYSIANDEPAWCAGTHGRVDRLGRKYTTGVVCVKDDGTTARASFDGFVPSVNGAFSTNLAKKIAEAKPGMSVNAMDLRFGIKDGKPFLVAPVTRVVGGLLPRTVPGGVFYVDSSGTMTYDSHATRGEYGVAVVPYRVAEDIRASINDRGSFYCADSRNFNKPRCLEERTSYEDTQQVNGTDAGGVNSENYSEFVLYRSDGTIGMVTPLTFYGKGRNITAYIDVDADEVKDGVYPTATLYEGVSEVSYRAIVQAITPAYTADVTWLVEMDASADTTTASRIFEITPTKPGHMALTIGTATNPEYVVEIEGTLEGDSRDFRWCIYRDAARTGASSEPIECRRQSDPAAGIGTLRGVNLGGSETSTQTPGTTVQVGTDFNLSELSTDELKQLIGAIADELAER